MRSHEGRRRCKTHLCRLSAPPFLPPHAPASRIVGVKAGFCPQICTTTWKRNIIIKPNSPGAPNSGRKCIQLHFHRKSRPQSPVQFSNHPACGRSHAHSAATMGNTASSSDQMMASLGCCQNGSCCNGRAAQKGDAEVRISESGASRCACRPLIACARPLDALRARVRVRSSVASSS